MLIFRILVLRRKIKQKPKTKHELIVSSVYEQMYHVHKEMCGVSKEMCGVSKF